MGQIGGVASEGKVVFLHHQQPVPLHFAQLVGQGAALHVEIVGQLLPVEGDGKAGGAISPGLVGQVGQQAAPDGFGRGVKDLPG